MVAKPGLLSISFSSLFLIFPVSSSTQWVQLKSLSRKPMQQRMSCSRDLEEMLFQRSKNDHSYKVSHDIWLIASKKSETGCVIKKTQSKGYFWRILYVRCDIKATTKRPDQLSWVISARVPSFISKRSNGARSRQ